MTPTLAGRIQTRIALLGTIGLLWTFIVVPFLPKGGATLPETYTATVLAVIVVAVVGCGWELLYHLVQQYRWEKDWPILYGLLVGIPEGILAFFVVDALIPSGPSPLTFALHFSSTWILVWLTAVGPLRVVLLRWRFNGGRIL